VYTEYHEKTASGCDSLTILDLTVLPENKVTLPDTTICDGDNVVLGSQTITKTGTYTEVFRSAAGCDSTVTLGVQVLDPIRPNVQVTEIVEDDDLGAFKITGTGYTYYTVNGTRYESSVEEITDLQPNTYLIVFYNDYQCEYAMTFDLTPGCVANIVYQRWNDVLSIKNPTYANGRSFVKYQWIEDGLPLAGETKSYYYAADGLNFSAVYEVEVTDSVGNVSLTCPFTPVRLVEDVSLSPSRVQKGGSVWLQTMSSSYVECYNTSGTKIFSREVSSGETVMSMPMISGMYIVTVYSEDGVKSFRVNVTE